MALRIDTPWLTSTLDALSSYDRHFSVLAYGKPILPKTHEIDSSTTVILNFPQNESGYLYMISVNVENPLKMIDSSGLTDYPY